MASTVSISLVLEVIGLQFVDQTDAAAFLTDVKQHPAAFLVHHFHGLVQLIPAVASQGAENVAGQAFGVNPDQNRLFGIDLAFNQGNMLQILHVVFVDDDLEFTGMGRGNDWLPRPGGQRIRSASGIR